MIKVILKFSRLFINLLTTMLYLDNGVNTDNEIVHLYKLHFPNVLNSHLIKKTFYNRLCK